jgi:hypothetical protein
MQGGIAPRSKPQAATGLLRPSLQSLLGAMLLLALAACGGAGAESSGGGTGGVPGDPGDPGDPGGGTRGGGTSTAVVNEFLVYNDSGITRNETLLASVPFAKGQHMSLDGVGVNGLATCWRVLQRWQDGSVRVAQAQFTDEVPANAKKTYEVVSNVSALQGSFAQHDWVAGVGVDVRIEVTDDHNVMYSAKLSDASPVTLTESYLHRERRWRLYMRNPNPNAGIGRDFLAARVYVKEFRDTPLVKIGVVVGNDYLGADNPQGSSDPNLYPLGPVSFKKLDVLVGKGYVAMRDHARQGSPTQSYDANSGCDRFTVFENDWFDDGQTKLWNFDLYCEHPGGSSADKAKWLANWQAQDATPLRPLATHSSWLSTKAFGVYGGPLEGPTDAFDRCEKELASWRGTNWFGPWGSWGDSRGSNTTGTPRNAPMSMAGGWAVMGENPRILEMLEGMTHQQACRTYHMWELEVGDRDGRYFWSGIPYEKGGRKLSEENHGRYDMWQNDPYASYRGGVNWSWGETNHKWNAYDAEHFSADLLFDYYTLTGDGWALDEMHMLGQCLKALMRLERFFTANIVSARAEGWCMQGFLQMWLVTGDDNYRDYALARTEEIVGPNREWDHASHALCFQFNHPLTGWPNDTGFFMPWQHGPVAMAFHAAYEYWGEIRCKRISDDVVASTEYAWVLGYQDPKWGFVQNGLRYYVPVEHNTQAIPANFFDSQYGIKFGDSPLGGAHEFLISGLYMIAQDIEFPILEAKALYMADNLLGSVGSSRERLWSKWCFGIPEGMLP